VLAGGVAAALPAELEALLFEIVDAPAQGPDLENGLGLQGGDVRGLGEVFEEQDGLLGGAYGAAGWGFRWVVVWAPLLLEDTTDKRSGVSADADRKPQFCPNCIVICTKSQKAPTRFHPIRPPIFMEAPTCFHENGQSGAAFGGSRNRLRTSWRSLIDSARAGFGRGRTGSGGGLRRPARPGRPPLLD
jgi:hypothetical protein